jgi:hypothetical protein
MGARDRVGGFGAGCEPDGDRGRQRSDLVAVIGCSSVVAATPPPIWEYLALYNRRTQYVKLFFLSFMRVQFSSSNAIDYFPAANWAFATKTTNRFSASGHVPRSGE